MAPRSFREAASIVQLTDFSAGILSSSLNPFYTDNNWENREYFPFCDDNDNAISIRQMIDAWKWPTSYNLVSKYPDESTSPNWTDDVQGIDTTENDQWIFTNTNNSFLNNIEHPRIWRVLFSDDIDSTNHFPIPDVDYAGLPESYKMGDMKYNHFGGCSLYYDPDENTNYIYVAVEYEELENRVVRFTVGTDFINFKDGAFVPQNEGNKTNAPCVAINPRNTTMALTYFNTKSSDDTHTLQIYSIKNPTTGTDEDWPFVDHFPLYDSDGSMTSAHRVQGMCISPAGHLYLQQDIEGKDGGGFYGFDLITGRQVKYERIDFSTAGSAWWFNNEFEDMCVRDFRNVPHHPSIQGQIHVQGLHKKTDSDAITIFHYSVPPGQEDWI